MGKLTLITLPIGNVADITARAKEALEKEQYFLAEDTRNLSKLLKHYGIDSKSKKIDSFHDHSFEKIERIVGKLTKGQSLCLVSDAGSPMISDPAYPLVRAALESGVEVESLSGISAVTCALELSGLPPHPFQFHGFLPRDKNGKKELFKDLKGHHGTHIFFESPYRMQESLTLLAQALPDVDVAVARELTKAYQSVYRFNSSELEDQEINYKGEFVLLFHLRKDQVEQKKGTEKIEKLALDYLDKKTTPKNLCKLLGEILDRNPSEIYNTLNTRSK